MSRSKLELIAENCKLNTEIAIQVLKIQTLKNEIEQLKTKNEKLTSEGEE